MYSLINRTNISQRSVMCWPPRAQEFRHKWRRKNMFQTKHKMVITIPIIVLVLWLSLFLILMLTLQLSANDWPFLCSSYPFTQLQLFFRNFKMFYLFTSIINEPVKSLRFLQNNIIGSKLESYFKVVFNLSRKEFSWSIKKRCLFWINEVTPFPSN